VHLELQLIADAAADLVMRALVDESCSPTILLWSGTGEAQAVAKGALAIEINRCN
jgi:hypothetical protein